jgi:hypothetical protein
LTRWRIALWKLLSGLNSENWAAESDTKWTKNPQSIRLSAGTNPIARTNMLLNDPISSMRWLRGGKAPTLPFLSEFSRLCRTADAAYNECRGEVDRDKIIHTD